MLHVFSHARKEGIHRTVRPAWGFPRFPVASAIIGGWGEGEEEKREHKYMVVCDGLSHLHYVLSGTSTVFL